MFATIKDMEKQKERVSRFGPKKEVQEQIGYEEALRRVKERLHSSRKVMYVKMFMNRLKTMLK